MILTVLVLETSVLLYELFRPEPGEEHMAVAPVDLSTMKVRVFVAKGAADLLLKTPFDLPAADRREAAMLDKWLFPGGDRHAYYILCAKGAKGKSSTLDFSAEPLVLEGPSGRRYHAANLAEALKSRSASLPAYVRFYLDNIVPPDHAVSLKDDQLRRFLFAYPAAAEPKSLSGASMGGTSLTPKTYTKDDLDGILDQDGGAEGPSQT